MESLRIGPKYLLCFIIILIIGFIGNSEEADTMDKMKAVKDKMFKNYDKTIRPTNGTNTTDVYVAFWPRQFLDFDEERSIFSLDSLLLMHWFDSRLKWNTSDYDGYMQLQSELLWLPDLSIYNSHSSSVDPMHDVLLLIHNSGYVVWIPPVHTQTACSAIGQTSYPYDEIECVVVMGSWAHDGWEINFDHSAHLDFDQFENIHPRWEVIIPKSYVERNETIYEDYTEPYISIHVHIYMKRRPVPEVEVTRVPCILIMILTLTIFWLPVDSSKKILLSGLLFLTLNVLLIYVAGKTINPTVVLPGVSFIRTAMYLVAITLLLQVFVVIKIASLTGPSRPPTLVLPLLTGSVGKYMFLRSTLTEDKMPLDQLQLKDESMVTVALSVKQEWKIFASAIDRVLFFLMIIVMIAVHHI